MNASRARKTLTLVLLLASAFGLWTCGGRVIIDEDNSPTGGDGGAGGTSTSSSMSTVASTGTGITCTEETCHGQGTNDCDCLRTCGSAVLEAKCAPNENKKLQCICSYSDVFSGACFETEPSLSCNIDKGCCAKYFQGI